MSAASSPTVQDVFENALEKQKLIHPLDRHRLKKNNASRAGNHHTQSSTDSCCSSSTTSSPWDLTFPNTSDYVYATSSFPCTQLFPDLSSPIHLNFVNAPTSMPSISLSTPPAEPQEVVVGILAADGIVAPFEDVSCILQFGDAELISLDPAICVPTDSVSGRVEWNQARVVKTNLESLQVSIHSETLNYCITSGEVALNCMTMPYTDWTVLDNGVRVLLTLTIVPVKPRTLAQRLTRKPKLNLSRQLLESGPISAGYPFSSFDLFTPGQLAQTPSAPWWTSSALNMPNTPTILNSWSAASYESADNLYA